MPSKKKLRAAAAPTHAETAALAVEQAIAFLTPYVESAKENFGPAARQAAERSVELALKAKDAAGPTAKLAAERGLELAHKAADAAAPTARHAAEVGLELAHKAADAAGPSAKHAADRGLEFAAKARENLEPHVSKAIVTLEPAVSKARESLEPHVDNARARVQQDLVPKLTELLNEAEQHPAVQQAKKKGAATLAKVTGTEIEVAKPKRRVGRTIAKVIAAGALLAGAAVAVRQFLADKDDAWTAPEASSTPVYTSGSRPEESGAEESGAEESGAEESGAEDSAEDSGAEDSAEEQGSDQGDHADADRHGEGSYVGENPPEGYEIKGNERSMKYHVPTSGGYERTIADVWFVSEEAANAAGFTRAQR